MPNANRIVCEDKMNFVVHKDGDHELGNGKIGKDRSDLDDTWQF